VAGVKADAGYKVVELSTVTDESIEEALNEWTGKGFSLDAIHFAMRESSRRPAMAFLVFTRPSEAPSEN
jgi:hypothetical protein